MEVTIHHLGNVQFEATTRGHRLVSDQPPANGGADSGMTPPEMMLAALGTCAGYYAAEYLKARSIATTGMVIKVTAEKGTQPARLASFRIELTMPAGLEARHEEGLLRAVHKCVIHNTLTQTPQIETVVRTLASA